MRYLVFVLAVSVATLAWAAEGDKEARKALSGTWVGQVDQGATGHKLIITATGISGTKDAKQSLGEGVYRLDVTQKPWHMDANGTKGPQKGRKYLGICELDGDTLKWCVIGAGNERPTEFATQDAQFLLILKRQ